MSRQALGKGLRALIPEKELAQSARVTIIPVDQICPNPCQPRKRISEESLGELVESIRSQGLLQPVLVKKSATGFELIAGERRWRAASIAGLKEIPAIVKEVGREESLAMAIVENIQRENLNPIDAATAYQVLANDFDLKQEDIARLVGKDRASVANYIRLLKLPAPIREDLAESRLSMGHARALLSLPDRSRQLEARDRILARGLSVRESETLVNKLALSSKGARKPKAAPDPHLAHLQEELKRHLATKVRITGKGRGGTIQIHYHSAEELDRLLEHLLSGAQRAKGVS